MMRTALFALLQFCCCLAAQAAWIAQKNPAPATTSFRAVQALDGSVVWVSGSGGVCLRTLDGGRTWQSLAVPGAEALDFRGLAALGSQQAVLISAGEAEKGGARIYRTADGGKRWQLVFESRQPGVFLDGVRFWDPKHGLVFGDPLDGAWFLLQTADGGQTWMRLKPAALPPILPGEAAFAASNSSLVVHGMSDAWIASGGAGRARVFHSADRGQTWRVSDTPMPSGATAGIFGLFFWDADHGIGVGGDHKQTAMASANVIITTDGGVTWRASTPTAPAGLKEGIVLAAEHELLAVGPSGSSLSSDRGQTWKKLDDRLLHAVSCAQGRCWAVGGKGLIVKWQ